VEIVITTTKEQDMENINAEHMMRLSRAGQEVLLELSETRLGIFQSAVEAVQSLAGHLHRVNQRDLGSLKQKFKTAATNHRPPLFIPLSCNESSSLAAILQAADQHRNHEFRSNTALPDQPEMHLISEDFRKQHENIYPPTMRHLEAALNAA
jgi:hypothetical protein